MRNEYYKKVNSKENKSIEKKVCNEKNNYDKLYTINYITINL